MKIAPDINIAMIVSDQTGHTVLDSQADQLCESSSTIKIPLILLAISTMVKRHDSLSLFLNRLPRHTSRGSGILNWTDARKFSLKDLLATTLIYSDCLATNMLLDYVGGYKQLNKWLEEQGLQTRIHMHYLDFAEPEIVMPKVGSTTAREMLELYTQLDQGPWPADVRSLIADSTANVHESWFENSLPAKLADIHHKTGSIINCGPRGESVFNCVGYFSRQGTRYYFCLLSHGWLSKNKPITENYAKQSIAKHFYEAVTSSI